MTALTQARLHYLFEYDATSGLLARKAFGRGLRLKKLGRVMRDCGYVQIGIDRKQYYAHRVIWFYVYGSWPQGQIDHRNGLRTDNRISNLRDVTRRVNSQNKLKHRLGKLPGAKFINSRWAAGASINGCWTHLGTYDTEDAAHNAYLLAIGE